MKLIWVHPDCLHRQSPAYRAHPESPGDAPIPIEDDLVETAERVRARAHYDDARALAPALPQELFAAIGYLTLAPGYLRALDAGRAERPLFLRQVAMVAASATGRI